MDTVFNDILAGLNDAAAKADLSDKGGNNWLPDPNTYLAMLEGVDTRSGNKDGRDWAAINPKFRIVDGDFEGRTFQDRFWFAKGEDATDSPGLKQLLKLARTISGREIRNVPEALQVIQDGASNNAVLKLETFKIEGKPRTYLKYLEAVDS